MLQIEIFSDVICPWCFIGKRRLDGVLAGELGNDVELRWRAFQLYPQLPLDGVDRGELLKRRYGDAADPARIPERIASEAEMEGIALRFDRITRTPNTLLAHRLLEFAYDQGGPGLQHALAEALFQGYFCDGVDVGQAAGLVAIAASTGMDAEAVDAFLNSTEHADTVASQLARAPELGISGVPGLFKLHCA